ncbi:MAG: hypothetical protein U5R48_11220 [Gammaproteobacteria bacterium]|nr:hypothetical protein [Gammaproteobacteria bacterium]
MLVPCPVALSPSTTNTTCRSYIDGEDFPNYESMALASLAWDITPSTTLRVTHYHQDRNMDPWDGGALVEKPDGSLAIPDVDPEQWYFSHPDQSKREAGHGVRHRRA